MSALSRVKEHTEKVREAAHGRWDQILPCLAPSIGAALNRPGRHITCPFHGGKSDFRVRKDYALEGRAHCTCGNWDGFSLLMQLHGWDFPTAVAEVEEVLGGGRGRAPLSPVRIPATDPAKQHEDDQKCIATMQRWWSQSVSLDHPSAAPARAYLKSRKLGSVLLPLDDIGFHPRLGYYDEDYKLVGHFPGLIAMVRMLDGRVSTVHRTYLTEDGRKAFEDRPVRKQYRSPSTHPVQGAALRLDPETGPVLNLAEGLETALAVRAITGQPTWSTLNKELLRVVHVPDSAQVVTIWADRDASYAGQEAAITLMDRLRAEGKSAVVMLPPFAK